MSELIINLAKPENSQVPVHISTYPDSQVNVEILEPINPESNYVIASRMSSYTDLIKIVATNDVLKYHGAKVSLFCPYILSSRSDRRFKENQSFDLKIVTNILNSCSFESITILDPHSDVLIALIDTKVFNIVNGWILRDYPKDHLAWSNKTLISPDAGSYKKMSKLSETLGLPMISASKSRNVSGDITTNFNGDVSGKNLVIVDDICDGGGTFIKLADILKNLGAEHITLFVTHGIFSKGTNLPGIDVIVTTNSYKEIEPQENLIVINLF